MTKLAMPKPTTNLTALVALAIAQPETSEPIHTNEQESSERMPSLECTSDVECASARELPSPFFVMDSDTNSPAVLPTLHMQMDGKAHRHSCKVDIMRDIGICQANTPHVCSPKPCNPISMHSTLHV